MGDENNAISKLESKYLLIEELLYEHHNSLNFFSIIDYLAKGNKKRPHFYHGSKKDWKKIVKIIGVDLVTDFALLSPDYNPSKDKVLQNHIQMYKNDTKLGNSVSTVGHSQGSLYANFAYDELSKSGDFAKYLNVSAFGTIADRVASTINNRRSEADAYVLDKNDDSIYLEKFDHLPFNAKNTNPPHKDGTHVFLSYINGNDTAPKIYTMIKNQIQENIDRPSRWKVVDESDKARKKGTSEYRIKISYGDKIVENVLPFGLSNKDKIHYVKIKGSDKRMLIKSSCNATSIIDHTNDSPEEELVINGKRVLYELEGAKQYIFGEKVCKDPSLFEVISQENPNTANWRVTVKNRETNETVEGVYPFNLKGSLYQLDSGEWVLASCGGEEIQEIWDGQKEGELYKLYPTDEIISAGDIDIVFKLYVGYRHGFDWCQPLSVANVVIVSVQNNQANVIKVIDILNNKPGNTNFGLFYYRKGSQFFEAQSSEDLNANVDNSWSFTYPKYKGGVGYSCGNKTVNLSYKFTQEDLEDILNK